MLTNNKIKKVLGGGVLLKTLLITFYVNSNSIASENNNNNNNNYCITKDDKGNIIYNKDTNKKCKLIKVLDSTQKNELTEQGEINLNGKPCKLTSTDNYANAEDLNGITISNGSTRVVRCNNSYAGDIVLKCNDGIVSNIGEDNSCIFVGCKKYDNGVLNNSLNNIVNNVINFNSIANYTKDTLLNNNKDKMYNKGDSIDTLTCKSGYNGNGYILKCNGNDEIILEGEGCKIAVQYMSPRTNKIITKYFDQNQSIVCNTSTFGSDPDSGTTKLCKINGYVVAKEGDTFTVNPNVNTNKFCHSSTIPYDLTGNLTGSASIYGWGDSDINRDTYKNNVQAVNGIITRTNSNSLASASGSVICQSNGKWKLHTGYKILNYTGITNYNDFTIPHGAKSSGKQFTIELWGAQGSGNGGKGGYTKLVTKLSNKFNDGTKLYVVVGGQGGYNGGGSGGAGKSGHRTGNVGGGATHIATANGLLSNLSGNKGAVIAVAGGGGGGGFNGSSGTTIGGVGGGNNNAGANGSGAQTGYGGCAPSTNGNCNATKCGDPACYNYSKSSFGKGGNGVPASTESSGSGGGAGYYGGGGYIDYTGAGGGGSGYCNTSYGSCSGSNGNRAGNGSAKISW